MREIGIVAGIVLVITSVSALTMVHWRDTLILGFWLVLVGFALGIPTGFIYHVQLYRVLKPFGELSKRWYWNPIPLNKSLRTHDRARVLPLEAGERRKLRQVVVPIAGEQGVSPHLAECVRK